MRLVDIATERRVTIAMFTIAVVLFGFVSLARLIRFVQILWQAAAIPATRPAFA